MPAISKIRFTNVVYENGQKRYNDDVFQFDGENGAILLENGGGKTVFIQTALQAILPNHDLADRKIKNTLMLENNSAHIAIEWIISERPRRYALTAVTLFMNKGSVDALKYAYEYEENDDETIEKLPFKVKNASGNYRPANKDEMEDYYSTMSKNRINAKLFKVKRDYHKYIEDKFKIIPKEWDRIATINGAEGDVEKFFDACATMGQLVDNLLIPTVEEALAGNGTKEFAETFEKQREHFKKYNQLKARIDESRQVENQVGTYIEYYKDYDEINNKVIETKEELKALYELAKTEQDLNSEKLSKINNEILGVNDQDKKLEQKEASYKLALLEKDMHLKKSMFEIKEDEYNKILNRKLEKDKRYSNLKVLKYKNDIKQEEELVKFNREQIENLDKDEEVVDIKDELDVNAGEIRGYYLKEEDKLNKQLQFIESQINTENTEIHENEKYLQEKLNNEKALESNKSNLEGKSNTIEEDIEKIKKEILFDEKQESVEDKISEWKNNLSELENKIFNNHKKKSELNNEELQVKKLLDDKRVDYDNLKIQSIELDSKLNKIKAEEEALIRRLKEFKNSFYSVEALHAKEASIIDQLENSLEKARENKEKAILDERISYRWLDDYKESEYYTADAVIEKYLISWRNQFDYIESGTTYIQRAAKSNQLSEEAYFEKFPYWAITLVVSEKEKTKLNEKISKSLDKLINPVIVMDEKETRDVLSGNKDFSRDNIFIPAPWKDNISQNYFESYRKEITEKAEEIKKQRIEKENEYIITEALLKALRKFYAENSYEVFSNMKKQFEEVSLNKNLAEDAIKQLEGRLEDITIEIKKIDSEISNCKEGKVDLEKKIEKANEYFIKNNKNKKLIIEIKKLKNELEILNIEIKKVQSDIKYKEDFVESLKNDFNEIDYNKRSIVLKEFYDEVKEKIPKSSNKTIGTLIELRKTLKDKLDNKQKNRKSLEDELRERLEKIKTLNSDLENFIKGLEVEIDEEFSDLINNDEMSRLIDEINDLKRDLKLEKKEYNQTSKNYEKSEIIYETKKDDYEKTYGNIIIFNEALEEVEELLISEKKILSEKKKKLEVEEKRLSEEKSELDKVINDFKLCNAGYPFLNEAIKDIELKDEVKNNFSYNRKEIVAKVSSNIIELQKQLAKRSKETEEQKERFLNFCENKILDIKLKKMAVDGVNFRKSYTDIIEWQNMMIERINKIIELLESDMREHDEEMKQFINHLHSYLVMMAQELKAIPKKTKIKLEDNWKEVYLFNVPEWNEKDGKLELYNHINWILKRLEGEEYRDENGVENQEKVKKSIEKWLQSKQLLPIVMNQKKITIKCRKVTNDGKMSSMPFSWEESNSWSGGEKWSKNMALFLGILNYVAEKRKQIIPLKSHYRTVIVDNPFGKASSDHVLDPVFFIAEQLGFQIIALTAHAEGKFIRTYFPIVYSCKLRSSENGNSQILTNEREIKKAFLKDADSEKLERLGQVNQIMMFES
ncbi:hypothetical protein [Clostridium beijerinckii]|jgi:hypothetical protein|uniref:Chromosome partition protein Smc n=2 Tax=Clostridium beijerinckii TaxID=1520 RepID=A0AAW3W3A6_CLOBE|nr:hypothetical protein [Clostridium beijerinckii]MBC2456881.1 hypothetical protein [Clostridium beijerinckii]MBC2473379.1 hypothetical protein [Clostridium beijerinckii]MDG5853187.1 hypothetical protein [Clostridium beijerinckii]NOV60337.1 hypothetical protein [Clostridium beijerinckii]NOW33805.1 hypothetical protein [Clostridium beijerinckii]